MFLMHHNMYHKRIGTLGMHRAPCLQHPASQRDGQPTQQPTQQPKKESVFVSVFFKARQQSSVRSLSARPRQMPSDSLPCFDG